MEIIKGLEFLTNSYPNTVLTTGNFDGVHLGHQKIFSMVLRRAEEIKGTSMAVTFEPHPLKVIAPEKEIKVLTTFNEKARIIEKLGIKVLLCIDFDKEFSQLTAADFIENVLVKKIGVREIVVGHNHAFGKDREGTVELLRRNGLKYGFAVTTVRNVDLHGDTVSSSKIRELLSEGRVLEASKFLGRAYSIEGKVIKGAGRGGKLLNIPTANITVPDKFVPKEGVYAVRVEVRDGLFDGVANIGRCPTFGNPDVSYEVHLFNFSDNLLGENIRIYFIDWIRDERRFTDVLSLEKQIRADIEHAKKILSKNHPKLI